MWVFAGGGESEVKGLVPLLEKSYRHHAFERRSPVRRKPGPRPSTEPGYGRTGKSLARQLEMLLSDSLRAGKTCDLILVIDDLDCHDPRVKRDMFHKSIRMVEAANEIESFVGVAAPEIEAWIIADWDNTVARHADFREASRRMQHWLSTERAVPFAGPETFSRYDAERDACREKLSDEIVEASVEFCWPQVYSKGVHTPLFLQKLDPVAVSAKCPHFRELHNRLSQPE